MIKKNKDTSIAPEYYDAPLSDNEFECGRIAVLVKNLRQETKLSQTEFSQRYGIAVKTLQDWEQGRRVPDQSAQSYLRVIQKMPDAVMNALEKA